MNPKLTRYTDIELRTLDDSQEDSRTVAGLAAVFNKETDMGWYIESIDEHAFDNADLNDVVLNVNHDNSILLAGTRNGTLRLYTDSEGLHQEATITKTTQGNDYLQLVKEGLIDKMSYAFTVSQDEWEEHDGVDYRKITKIDKVYDVSLVTFPAYPQTYVGVRNGEELDELAKEHFKRKEQDKRMEELLNGKDFI